MPPAFENESEIDNLISQFLVGTLPKAAWLWGNSPNALDRLRSAIPRYNEATGGQNSEDVGYHETLTCFWPQRVAEALPPASVRPAANGFRPT